MMKGLFLQYEDNPNLDFGKVWSEALFVFDTNVLLNLYRYHSTTRDELLDVLGQLSNQIWIPHHVALEFQRNRLKVIGHQNNRYLEVRKTIEAARDRLKTELQGLDLQKRHSQINPQPLMDAFAKLIEDFFSELDRLQEMQQKPRTPDPLKERIESLFEGRVGAAPKNQTEIDELYKQAELRYKFKIPPGFHDAGKDKDDPDEYIHGNIIYKRKFGDYLIWKQLLSHASAAKLHSVILVTDDAKDDWWWKINSGGSKTIGPRPELLEEARLSASVDCLLMYNPENFLKFAKELLKSKVSEETLEEIRDVSTATSNKRIRRSNVSKRAFRAEQAVKLWLEGQFDSAQENPYGFPDLVARRDSEKLGFDVSIIENPEAISSRVVEKLRRSQFELRNGTYDEIAIILIVRFPMDVRVARKSIAPITRMEFEVLPGTLRRLKIIIGVFEDPAKQ